LVLVLSAGVGFAISNIGGRHPVGPVSTTAPAVPKDTEAAVVRSGVLSVVNEETGKRMVIARGPHSRIGSAINTPAFSPDGDWIAYLEQTGPSFPSLHVARISGGSASTVAGVLTYAWSPTRDELAASLAGSVELLNPAGRVLRDWTIVRPGNEVFSPSGNEIAVGGHGLLLLNASGPSRPTVIVPQHVSQCQIPAGWTADSSRILSWQDGQCSASIAADGLPLKAFPVSGGPSVALGQTLPHPSWVVPVSGVRILVNVGTDRVAADHKALRSCNAATGACALLPLPSGESTLDPAVAAGAAELFEVRVPQSTAANDFAPPGTLWVSPLSGRTAHQVEAAGTGVYDSVPSAGGETITFVRLADPGLVEVLDVHTGRVHEIATVDEDDYYGEFLAAEVFAVWQPAR
jgi:hypothetical protein